MSEPVRPQLKQAQAAYLAGIIDGEGYIGLCKSSGKSFGLRVVVTSGCEEMVNWIKETTGFGKVSRYELGHRQRQNSYQWRVFGEEAALLLKSVAPHLIIKKAQATIGLRFQENTALSGQARLEFGKKCSDSIKLLNSRQAWQQNVARIDVEQVSCTLTDAGLVEPQHSASDTGTGGNLFHARRPRHAAPEQDPWAHL